MYLEKYAKIHTLGHRYYYNNYLRKNLDHKTYAM